MAQSQSSLSKGVIPSEEKDERELKQIVYDTVENLTLNDPDTTEAKLIFDSTQEAKKESNTDDQDESMKNCANKLIVVAEEVDGVADKCADQIVTEVPTENVLATLKDIFSKLSSLVFKDGVTLGKICVLLLFAYKLVKKFLRKLIGISDRVLGKKVTEFIIHCTNVLVAAFLQYKVLEWVRSNGGWQKLLQHTWKRSEWSSWIILGACAVIVATILYRQLQKT